MHNSSMNSDEPVQFVSELNQFYARFDVTDFSSGCDHVCDGLVPSPAVINEPEVTKCFLHVNPQKTPGPDGTRLGGGWWVDFVTTFPIADESACCSPVMEN